MLSRTALRWASVAWVLILIVASLQPVRPVGVHYIPFRHRALHFLEFAFTAVLLLSLSRSAKQFWTGAFGILCLALGIETAQFAIYHLRDVEWWDVRDDTIGAILGIVVLRITRIRNVLLSGAD